MTAVHAPAAEAVAQLDTDAQRAGLDGLARIVRDGGPTAIHFTSRADYERWADFGLIAVDPSPARTITVGRTEVHVPVTFGWPTTWAAVATYPTQDACTCGAEPVHMLGCPAEVYDEPQGVTHRIAVGGTACGGWDDDRDFRTAFPQNVTCVGCNAPAAVLQSAPECPDCGVLNGSHQSWCHGRYDEPEANPPIDEPTVEVVPVITGTPAEVAAQIGQHFGREANADECARLNSPLRALDGMGNWTTPGVTPAVPILATPDQRTAHHVPTDAHLRRNGHELPAATSERPPVPIVDVLTVDPFLTVGEQMSFAEAPERLRTLRDDATFAEIVEATS